MLFSARLRLRRLRPVGIARDAGIGGLGSVKKSGALGPVWPLAPFRMGGLRSVVASLLVLMMLVAGCGDGTVDNHVPPSIPGRSYKFLESRAPTSSVTAFPRHHAPLGTDRGGEYFAAQLVLQEGCLRAEVASKHDPNDPGSWLLIWPNGFTFAIESETVRVVNELGRVVAHVGGHIRLSPAAATFRQATEQGLIEGLSDDCAGPYFLVGDEVTAFDLGSEATELRLSDPDVVFFRERTVIARHQTLMQAAGVGELILDGPCLRLKDSSPREYWPTIIWPAGFTPHVNDGVVEIRNGAGRVVAQVGNQIAGGGGYFERTSGDCSGPVWRANTMKTLPDVEVYFPKQDGSLAPEDGTELFSGKLILWEKCLQVADDVIRVKDRVYAGISPLIIWPHDFALSVEGGVVGIVNANGSIVARVGDEVEFDAFNLTYEEAREHGGLAEITPACSGPYWAVGETFAAVPAP